MLDDEQILEKTTALLDILQEKCWDGYKQVGLKKKGDRMVPNCVPVNEKVIREVTEYEMRVIEDVLDDLENGTLFLSLGARFCGGEQLIFSVFESEQSLRVDESEGVLLAPFSGYPYPSSTSNS